MYIIKIGGGQLINLKEIIADLKTLDKKYLIVHGANYLRNSIAEKLGYRVKTIKSPSGNESIRSDSDLMDIFLMTYAGLRNKRLVELARQNNINAIGLSGIDGGLITGTKNKKIISQENNKLKVIKNDLSGKPSKINQELISLLLKNNYVPFVCPPILSEENIVLNTENDDIVSLFCSRITSFNTVIQFIEAPGILKDKNNPNTLIKNIKFNELDFIEKNHTAGRMKRKVRAIKNNFKSNNINKVIVADGRIKKPINNAINNDSRTIITR